MKSFIIYLLILVLPGICYAQLLNPQDKKITEKFFPDVNVEINTPAFHKKKGFTKYKEMIAFLEKIVINHSDAVNLSYIGESQKGKKIPFIRINKPSAVSDKVKVWIQGGIHGDEPASTEGVLLLIQQLLDNDEYANLLDELEIGIIPMANIDGYEAGERTAANGLDLNRDQTKLIALESIYLKKAFSDFSAEVAIDFHEFNPFRADYLKMGKQGYTLPFDVMFLYAGNLNVSESLRKFTSDVFVKNTMDFLSENELKSHDYFSTSSTRGYTIYNIGSINPRASATSYALSNCVSSIVEVRGVNIGKTSFKRRVYTTFLTAISYMNIAVKEKEALRSVLAKSEVENQEIIVRSAQKVSPKEMEFVDLVSASIVRQEINARNAFQSRPILTRSIPNAYLILAKEKDIVKKLTILGVKIDTLQHELDLQTEKYIVTDYKKNQVKYEGVFQQTIKTESNQETKKFPVGTYIIYTNQKNKGLIFETLEPEAPNGFISFGVLKTKLGNELPIYRSMDPKLKKSK